MKRFSVIFIVMVGLFAASACDDDPNTNQLWCVDTCLHGGICVSLKANASSDDAECRCPVGYTGLVCQDCDSGYEADADGNCQLIVADPCEDNPCGVNGTCTADGTAFTCECSTGYAGETCQDCDNGYINVGDSCVADPCQNNPCLNGGTCDSSTGVAVCSCVDNHTGDDCSDCNNGFVLLNDGTCSLNSCSNNPCAHGGNCSVDLDDGSAVCSCVSPYTGATCEDCELNFVQLNDGSCVVDSCEGQTCSEHGTCQMNMDDGSVSCSCDSGYETSELSCVDVNECLSDPCPEHSNCSNLDGSYSCSCYIGYTGANCDSCDTANNFVEYPAGSGTCVANSCDPNPCQNGGVCTLDASGFADCACVIGYTGANCEVCDTADGFVELSDGSCIPFPCLGRTCSDHGTCGYDYNTGDAFCDCDSGYESFGMNCVDTNECLSDPCDSNATCTNMVGSFTCECNTGFTGDGTICSDVDECASDPCDSNATCTNTVGSFTCECNTGFTGDGTICSDVDECASDPCDSNATCTNTVGSFTCECNTGFTGDGTSCSDIDECASDPCDPNATCTNNVGSFTCECNTGFTGDGTICSDVDECASDPCDPNATCTNTVGSFTCECNTGFTGDGTICSDVDECASDPCDPNATCTNTVGSFTCECNTGFTGDGTICSDVDECASDPCDSNATCTNNVGSFTCECDTGFTGDGMSCNDIDECALGTHDCEQVCTNTVGAYTCSCDENYRLMSDHCVPMFSRIGGGAIQDFAEINGELYAFGNNEIVITYDATADDWRGVWRPDISFTETNNIYSVRNDFMAAVTDGQTAYILAHYWDEADWYGVEQGRHNIVKVFTPGDANPWSEIAEIPVPTTGYYSAGTRPPVCNDLGINAEGTLLWSVCDDGRVYKYNFGSDSWTAELVHDSTDLALNKIWVRSSSDIFVVGDAGFLSHWNGSVWTRISDPVLDTDLHGIWGYSSTDYYIGGQGKLWHYNGSDFTLVKTKASNPERYFVKKIAGTPDKSRIAALAVGDRWYWGVYSTEIFESTDAGSSFASVTEYYYHALKCFDQSCYVGGMDGVTDKHTKLRKLGETEMIFDHSHEPRAVGGNSDTAVVFAGQFNQAVFYNGHRYLTLEVSVNEVGNDTYNAVWGDGTGFWLAGPGADANSTGYLVYWDGTDRTDSLAFSKHSSDATEQLYAVHGCSVDDVWAVGDQGTAIHWDGNAWSATVFPGVDNLTDVYCVSSSEVYAIGRDFYVNGYSNIYKWTGASWSKVYVYADVNGRAQNILKDSSGEICVAFKDVPDSFVQCSTDHGSSWYRHYTPGPGNAIIKIWGSKDNLFVLSSNGLIINYYDGQEIIIHRDSSSIIDDDGQQWTDVYWDSVSGYTVVTGTFNKILEHRDF